MTVLQMTKQCLNKSQRCLKNIPSYTGPIDYVYTTQSLILSNSAIITGIQIDKTSPHSFPKQKVLNKLILQPDSLPFKVAQCLQVYTAVVHCFTCFFCVFIALQPPKTTCVLFVQTASRSAQCSGAVQCSDNKIWSSFTI